MADVDVAVVGSGVIGLSCAWSLARAGRSVLLLDEHPASGASYVAAGMIAPVGEAAFGEEEIARLAITAAQAWPAFAKQLEHDTDRPSSYLDTGSLIIAKDGGDRAQLEQLFSFQASLGLSSSWLTVSAARDKEPLLSPQVQGGIWAPSDHQVDNRVLLGELSLAVERWGVQIKRGRAEIVISDKGELEGVRSNGELIDANLVLLAAGVASTRLVPELVRGLVPVRPVKGQILRLSRPSYAAMSHSVRGLVHGRSIYIVPRASQKIVIGATVEEMGADQRITAGAVKTMLEDATEMLPFLEDAELLEASAGLRPGTPDNLPIIGPSSIDRLLIATGHYRHGIMFAPITADLITSYATGRPLPHYADSLHPMRFNS